MMHSQDNDLQNFNLSNISNNSSPIYPSLYKRDVLHKIESVKVEHQMGERHTGNFSYNYDSKNSTNITMDKLTFQNTRGFSLKLMFVQKLI